MSVNPAHARAHSEYDGQTVSFCGAGCKAAFDANPDRYLPACR
jgi:Cu+-exporting ATPase